MALDGNGTYLPPAPQFPAIPNTVIYADDFNQIILDIATALSTAIFRDGQAAFTANQSMGGHKLTNLANGTNPQDATTVLQVFTDPVFVATTLQGFKVTGSMFQALMTTISMVASGTLTLTGATLLDASASGEVRLPANTSIGGVSASELATLDGITATTAELNKLHGATLSTAELNILAGAVITVADLNNIPNLAPKNSPNLTGIPTAPTAPTGTNSNQIATTEFVRREFAELDSPVLTGTPKAPTAAPGTNNEQLATTAFAVQLAFQTALPVQINDGKWRWPLSVNGMTSWQGKAPQPISANTTLIPGEFLVDSSAGPLTLTLPTTPTTGSSVRIIDAFSTFWTNNVTLVPGGSDSINGNTSNLVIDLSSVDLLLVYKSGDWSIQ